MGMTQPSETPPLQNQPFDRAVRRKPLAGAADAVLWEFNRSLPGNRCQKRDSAKTLLLMLIDVVVFASILIMLARGG